MREASSASDPPTLAPRALVARLGPHPAAGWGIDLDAEGAEGERAFGRWWVAALLLASARGDERRAAPLLEALRAARLAEPAALVEAGVPPVSDALERAGERRAAALAGRLVRSAASLGARFEGSFERLAASADGIDELGARLVGLGPGVGAGAALRFLRPLRERWTVAGEVPLSEAARAAAVHLGWIDEGEDAEGAPGALRRALADRGRGESAPALRDVEAALERLGLRACLRGRPGHCPLAAACPARG